MPARLLALALLALVLTVTGCGGSPSADDYEASVVDARNRVDEALAHITDDPEGREELLQRMDEASVAIAKAAEDLDDADVPEGFGDENDELVAAIKQLGVDLSATADQIRQPDFQGLLDGTQGLSFDSWDDVNAVFQKLRAEGIDVPNLGRH